MSTYGADVEALRQLATTIDGGAGVLDDARTSVRNAYQSAFWSGPDAQQARGQWDGQLEPSLARTAQALRDAAATLRSNADAQERTSTAGGGTGGGAPVAPGGSAGGGSGNSSGSGSGSGSGDAPGGGPAVNVKNTQESSADNGSLGSPATEGSKGSVSGGVTYDPTTGETTVSGSGSLENWFKTANGSTVTFGLTGGAELTSGQKSEDGFTTWTTKSDVSVGVEGGFDKGGNGISGSYTTGVTSEYAVKVPDDAKVTDPGSVNPFDPSTMPTGSTVTMDSGSYQGTELEASFRHIALESGLKESAGVSSIIEKTGDDTVRITSGPTDALSNSFGLGLDFDVVKAMLGNTTSLDGASLRSAELDLSTPEGKAAYDAYLLTGEIPADPSTGVSGLTKIEKLDYKSTTSVGVETPVGGASWDVGENSGSAVVTTYPDGSAEQQTKLSYGGRSDTFFTQSFGADGTEDPSGRSYTYTVKADEMTTQLFNQSEYSGLDAGVTVKEGDTLRLTLTEQQMAKLHTNAMTFTESYPGTNLVSSLATDYDGAKIDTFDYAANLARGPRSDYDLVQMLYTINQAADGDLANKKVGQFPGTITPAG
ncbi:WXG100 family type VII secretion target [Oerskovia jenensis]|uniref:WXG100 family type VII secretion target n=1 Tax=Oerskovia jenensis TaxID=162169 RepID=A0ABS2LH61_9CELL|nr:WXG100 family type VII secretion target [Oerskovia jenensis]MBM7479612.1 hypothetical protein [Oerskovia jenensis]